MTSPVRESLSTDESNPSSPIFPSAFEEYVQKLCLLCDLPLIVIRPAHNEEPDVFIVEHQSPSGFGSTVTVSTGSSHASAETTEHTTSPMSADPVEHNAHSPTPSSIGADEIAGPSSGSLSLERLLSCFNGVLTQSQIEAVYESSGRCYYSAWECLREGPTTDSFLQMLSARYQLASVVKVPVDADDMWQDVLLFYKTTKCDTSHRLRFRVCGAPVIDTGGVRRQIYTVMFNDFASNKFIHLFDGPPHSLHLVCTAMSRGCGLYKILGKIIGHSIGQDGIGFPYLSQASFWYMVRGEDIAMEYASVDDVGADIQVVIAKVSVSFPCSSTHIG